jgi:hypothetical protein
MTPESSNPTASRAVYAILLCVGYAYVLFFFIFMFRSFLWPDYFAH